jgi:GNAT superfamily N-acetyltransferase
VAISDPGRLSEQDVPAGLALSAEAGWNQTADDWRLFVTRGDTFGIRDDDSCVASAAALSYGGCGMVAMVLTTATHRRRGFAATLFSRAVRTLTDVSAVPILDATPDGLRVYERQGFRPVEKLERWVRYNTPKSQGFKPPPIRYSERPPGEAERFSDIDESVFGARRDVLFADVMSRPSTISSAAADSFVLARRGRIGTQVGPLVARDEVQALSLLEGIVARIWGVVIIDVPTRWTLLRDWLPPHGFRTQRPFTRMALDRSAPFGDPGRLFASAGPEFG